MISCGYYLLSKKIPCSKCHVENQTMNHAVRDCPSCVCFRQDWYCLYSWQYFSVHGWILLNSARYVFCILGDTPSRFAWRHQLGLRPRHVCICLYCNPTDSFASPNSFTGFYNKVIIWSNHNKCHHNHEIGLKAYFFAWPPFSFLKLMLKQSTYEFFSFT